MLSLIKQVFSALLSFSGSLTSKYVSLNNEPSMLRPTFFDLNPVEVNYNPFMVGLDKRNWSCNNVDDLSPKICLASKSKDLNVKQERWNVETYKRRKIFYVL